MTIELMLNSLPKNQVTKTPERVGDPLSGTLKEGSSVTDPIFLIQAAALPACNYARIADFNRFYFIRDIVNTNTDLWEVHLHVDVLFTFKDAILNSPCIITKTASNDFNLYLPDPNFKCQQNTLCGMQSFPSGFNLDDARYYVTFFG